MRPLPLGMYVFHLLAPLRRGDSLGSGRLRVVNGAGHTLDMECQNKSTDFLGLVSEGHVQTAFDDGLALLACPCDPLIRAPTTRASQRCEQLGVPRFTHVVLAYNFTNRRASSSFSCLALRLFRCPLPFLNIASSCSLLLAPFVTLTSCPLRFPASPTLRPFLSPLRCLADVLVFPSFSCCSSPISSTPTSDGWRPGSGRKHGLSNGVPGRKKACNEGGDIHTAKANKRQPATTKLRQDQQRLHARKSLFWSRCHQHGSGPTPATAVRGERRNAPCLSLSSSSTSPGLAVASSFRPNPPHSPSNSSSSLLEHLRMRTRDQVHQPVPARPTACGRVWGRRVGLERGPRVVAPSPHTSTPRTCAWARGRNHALRDRTRTPG